MNHRTTAGVLAAAILVTLVGCTPTRTVELRTQPAETSTPKASTTADRNDALKAAGIPPEPTGTARQALLDALAAVNPDVVRYEDKAIDASRNQCSAFGEGVQRPDWLASQRFTYKDVTTSEAQGKEINAALKRLGFCNV